MKKSGKLRYYTSWPQKEQSADLVDLSPNGMRFICREHLKLGLQLQITSPLLKASAIVVNVSKKADNNQELYTVGVRFQAVSYADAKGSFYSASV